MKQAKSSVSPANQRGVALLEGLMSILLISIALIGLMGLQANMVKATEESRSRNEAARAVQQQVAALWAAPNPATLAGDRGIPNLPNSNLSTTACGPSCYTIIASWREEGAANAHNVTFVAHVR